MEKIFLSHSSKDKEFVRPIFDYFGADRCVFDEMTFDEGIPTLVDIFKGIDDSDIFVFFISEASLNSKWVEKEIYYAKDNLNNDVKRLSQIFPIIIDENINYDDVRIPDFLKVGFGAYNLRHINSAKLACKKIDTQIIKRNVESSLDYEKKLNFFYGRDIEKKAFKDFFDDRDANGTIRTIKCMIVSGIDGIGRKAYARATLKDTELIEKYYFPMIVSLTKEDTIDDLILKLCIDLGLGDYGVEDIQSLVDMNSKIELLAEVLSNAQKYNEKIIIQDDLCIVKPAEVIYWFENALKLIKNQITVIITTRINLRDYKVIRSSNIFNIQLQNLSRADTFGFLRGYSKVMEIPFSDEDISFFSQILIGYPPQIQYCVDLALEQKSIQYVKDNSYLVAQLPQENSAKLLDRIIEEKARREYHGFLAMMAQLGTVSISLINEIIKIDKKYKDVYLRIRAFSICSTVGSSGDQIKINDVIRDYILRNDFTPTEEIRQLLNSNIEEFVAKVDDKEYMDYLTFAEFSFYAKENLKKGNKVPDKFLYSTIYVRTIVEWYNSGDKNYQRIIDLVKELRESSFIDYCDDNIRRVIEFYNCSSLARLQKVEFDAAVCYFREYGFEEDYFFLKGFYFRLKGLYKEAEDNYTKVLDINPRHERARRELVLIYNSMQDYNTAVELAEKNYLDYPDNPYQMQAYFDCLIHKGHLSEKEKSSLDEIISTAESIYRTNANSIYYQLKAKYAAFIMNDKKEALSILIEGINGLSASSSSFYLWKDYFDICKKYNDISGMEKAHSKLKDFSNNPAKETALLIRKCYLDAYKGVNMLSIRLELKSAHFTEVAFENICSNIERITKSRQKYNKRNLI